MYKLFIAALLWIPGALIAQSPDISSSLVSSGPAEGPAVSTPAQNGGTFNRVIFTRRGEQTPIATYTASYVYRYAPDWLGANRSQMGWSAVPEVNFGKYIGFQGDVTSLYTRGIYPGANQLLLAAGPRITLAPRGRVTPFIFGEGGEIRTTRKLSHLSDWNPVAVAGIGMDFHVGRSKLWAFQLVPGEYVGQQLNDGNWIHSFTAKAGITFNMYK